MIKSQVNKSFFKRHWQWLLPSCFIVFCIGFFFLMTGDATLRYGSIVLRPELVNKALARAKVNKKVKREFGELQSHDFFKLLEGDVFYNDDPNSVAVTVGIVGTKRKGKLDIWAHKVNGDWVYDSIVVRIKKPEKLRILVFKKQNLQGFGY